MKNTAMEWVLGVGVAVGLALAPSVASADRAPSKVNDCLSKTEGTACTPDPGKGEKGVCAKSTCSKWEPSSDSAGKKVEYECLECIAEGAAPAEANPAEAKPAEAEPKAPAKSEEAKPAVEKPKEPAKGTTGGDADKGCSVAGETPAPLALGFMLALGLAARRRRR